MTLDEAQRFIQSDDGRSPFWAYQSAARALDRELCRLQKMACATCKQFGACDILEAVVDVFDTAERSLHVEAFGCRGWEATSDTQARVEVGARHEVNTPADVPLTRT